MMMVILVVDSVGLPRVDLPRAYALDACSVREPNTSRRWAGENAGQQKKKLNHRADKPLKYLVQRKMSGVGARMILILRQAVLLTKKAAHR